jgi:hypothetical protein
MPPEMPTLHYTQHTEDGPSIEIMLFNDNGEYRIDVREGFAKGEGSVAMPEIHEMNALLKKMRVPVVAVPLFEGLGSSHELTIGRPLKSSSFRWLVAVPAEWEQLGTIVAILRRLAWSSTGLPAKP